MPPPVDPILLLVAKMIFGAIMVAVCIIVCDHFWPTTPKRKR